MLEEKNDNLPSADGIQENNSLKVNNVTVIEEIESSTHEVVTHDEIQENHLVDEIMEHVETVQENSNNEVEIAPDNELEIPSEKVYEETSTTSIAEEVVNEVMEINELVPVENEIKEEEEHLVEAIESNDEETVMVTEEITTEPIVEEEIIEQTIEHSNEQIITEVPHVEKDVIEKETNTNSENHSPEINNNEAIAAIDEVNAEENEDDTLDEESQIPMKDYESLTMEQLFDELSQLNTVEKVNSVKNHVEEVKKSFFTKYYQLIEEKKAEFYNENPESTEEFQYNFPLKNKFDQLNF